MIFRPVSTPTIEHLWQCLNADYKKCPTLAQDQTHEKDSKFLWQIVNKYKEPFLNTTFRSAHFCLTEYTRLNREIHLLKSKPPHEIPPQRENQLKTLLKNVLMKTFRQVYFSKARGMYWHRISFDQGMQGIHSQRAEKNVAPSSEFSKEKDYERILADATQCFDSTQLRELCQRTRFQISEEKISFKDLTTQGKIDRWLIEQKLEKCIGRGANGGVFLCQMDRLDYKEKNLTKRARSKDSQAVDLRKMGSFRKQIRFVVKVSSYELRQQSAKRKTDTLDWIKKHVASRNVNEVIDIRLGIGRWAVKLEMPCEQNLRTFLDNQIVDYREFLSIIGQIASGLAAMHKAKVVHGDIKGRNIMYNGKITIVDLEDSYLVEQHVWRRIGTPGYRPWEHIIKNAPIAGSFDVWSLGVLAFEVLSRARAISIPRTLRKQLNRKSIRESDMLQYLGLWQKFLPIDSWLVLKKELRACSNLTTINRSTPNKESSFYWINRLPKFAEERRENISKIIGSCLAILPEKRISAANLVKMIDGMNCSISDMGILPEKKNM